MVGSEETPLVRVEHFDSIAQVVLDRAATANALSLELLTSLIQVIDEQVEAGVRAVVLSGAGGRFSGGADFDDLNGDARDVGYDDAVAAAGQALAAAPFPVVAGVEKYAFGAGVDLAWSCDAVVVASDARLAVPATRLGLLYNPASLVALHARIGDRAWRRLVLLGDELDGATAFALGMGEALAGPGEAVEEATRLASSAIAGSADAVAASKAFGKAIIAGSAGERRWEDLRRELLASEERREALAERQRDRRGS